MGIIDSKTGKEKKYSAEEIQMLGNELRGYALTALCCAGSGHAGGTLSCIDIVASLFLNKLRHDPKNTSWEERDRFFISKAHTIPAFYTVMAYAGYWGIEETMALRKLGSKFQGHSDWIKCKGLEMSGGSLGQGLGISVGDAVAAKIYGKKYRVYCLMGDGEQDEGSIWESAMAAAHFKLDNLVGIVDRNLLQIDGWTKEVMEIDPLAEKYKAFGWNVIEVNGHSIKELLKAFDDAEKAKGKPTLVLAHTVKGKGVSFMENIAGWHGKAPNKEELMLALKELKMEKLPVEKMLEYAKKFQQGIDERVNKKLPKFSQNYWWNSSDKMKSEMKATRFGWGEALEEIGADERVVTIRADISDSICISLFSKNHPERKNRVLSVGIQEADMMLIAGGLAKEGKIPVTGTYGVFASGRPWDQLRTSVCYGKLNVKIGGAHGGISVGPDGATHQSLEEITIMGILPNMTLFAPCDSIETRKITKKSYLGINGPTYVRFGREATPIVTKEDSPAEIGIANIIRFRGEKENFADAFEITASSKYRGEKEDLSIIACGAMVPEAMRAAWILKKEFNLETRVINMHSIKPLDRKAIVQALKETGCMLTVEEHQVGGFGNIVAGTIAREKSFSDKFVLDMIGIQDRFGESGAPWELIKEFGLSAEHIAEKAKELVGKKK